MVSGEINDPCSAALDLLSSGVDGTSAALSLSGIMDRRISAAFAEASAGRGSCPEITVTAVGGYGRSEMAPYSDVDIMVLARDRGTLSSDCGQAFLYRLWDLGLNISHSFRTLGEALEDSMKDLKTRTLLIDSRYVAGSRELFAEFGRDVSEKLLFKSKKTFISDILRDIQLRHRTYGESLYLLEPHIKEGRGGLRDIHCIGWLLKILFRGAEGATYGEVVSRHKYDLLMKARDFLLKVRLWLHCTAGRKNDVLSYEYQEEVARSLGFHDTGRFYAPELLMRRYYRETGHVSDLLSRLGHHAGRRFFSLPFGLGMRKLSNDFYTVRNELTCRTSEVLSAPEKILEAFLVYAQTGKRLSHDFRDTISTRAKTFHKRHWTSKSLTAPFVRILKGERVYETLSAMHDLGVLDRLLPEFGRLNHLVVYELYHRYTVDEHSLLAIRNLESAKNSRELKLQYLAEMFKSIKQEVLFLAILLHDIGKGVSKRHEEAGYRLIKDVLERFDLANGDKRMIEFLVRHHITLARLALTRDPSAPESIAQITGIVGSEDSLKALYLMTYADMTAVNPDFWTDWKAVVFHELYEGAIGHLRGLSSTFEDLLDLELRDFAKDMPERYLLSEPFDTIARDHGHVKAALAEGLSAVFQERLDGTVELTVATRDRPGLFSRIVGLLSARGFNILRARLYTSRSGVVVDKILVSNWRSLWWEGLEEGLRRELRASLLAEREALPGASPKASPAVQITAPQRHRFEYVVEIDNETSDTQTLVEIALPDRVGLLYDITRVLYLEGVDIESAVINTEDGVAQDVFYTRQQGTKLSYSTVERLLGSLYESEIKPLGSR
jgi:[protein-PII] uridylyltransferase